MSIHVSRCLDLINLLYTHATYEIWWNAYPTRDQARTVWHIEQLFYIIRYEILRDLVFPIKWKKMSVVELDKNQICV